MCMQGEARIRSILEFVEFELDRANIIKLSLGRLAAELQLKCNVVAHSKNTSFVRKYWEMQSGNYFSINAEWELFLYKPFFIHTLELELALFQFLVSRVGDLEYCSPNIKDLSMWQQILLWKSTS
ncbi:hypothetical protein ACJIZ3_005624 [Penstemon smallii]|uniref:Uncharacterized protein n=1 Tax=Penstemon smallii TaxID=265156 RepID=A0ABD3S5K0_9LAMI